MQNEQRTYNLEGLEQRAVERIEDGEKKRYIEGYAAVFNQMSRLLVEPVSMPDGTEEVREFYEVITPGAFDRVMSKPDLDVIYTVSHDFNKVIARTRSGTLKLSVDDRGLFFSAEVPNVSYANDTYESVKRGDLYENSFTFFVKRESQKWERGADNKYIRYINKIDYLHEVGTVTQGSYENTDVAIRGLKDFIMESENRQLNQDTEAEITGILSEKENRIGIIRDLIGRTDFNEDTKLEVIGLIEADISSNQVLIDLMGVSDENIDPDDTEEAQEQHDEMVEGRDLDMFEKQLNILKAKNK